MRLGELLARNLGLSRTAARRLIEAGRVTDERGARIDDRKAEIASGTGILVGGEPVTLYENALVLQHKPLGVVTALRDGRHPTAYALLEDAPLFTALRPVGRLDLETSGLLLWTSDGQLLSRLTHPKRAVPRTYHAALARPFRRPSADLVLSDGHRPNIVALDEIAAAECHPALRPGEGATVFASITLAGGAYHEVRRIFAALGSHVTDLCRVAHGEHTLPRDLEAGAWRLV